MAAVLPPEARSDLDTAVTLTLIALILEVVFLAIGVLVLAFFLFALAVGFSVSGPTAAFSLALQVAVPLGVLAPLLFFAALGVLSILWVVLTYVLVYQRLRRGQVEEALTPALVLGILTLVFGGTIPGILLVIAYVKAKDAHAKILLAQQPRG